MSWKTIDRPGYLGTDRDLIQKEWEEKFGRGNWRIAWQWGDKILEKREAFQIYEDGYYEYFKANPEKLNWLIRTACDVFDTSPSNVKAGFSYDVQETPNNHIHDVSIRRAVLRNGRSFYGDHLVHVRPGKEGAEFGPQMIPFHLPHMIYNGNDVKYKGKPRDFVLNPPWWIEMGVKRSVEQFYQMNKVLQMRVNQ